MGRKVGDCVIGLHRKVQVFDCIMICVQSIYMAISCVMVQINQLRVKKEIFRREINVCNLMLNTEV